VRPTSAQIGFEVLEELLILKEPIQLSQLGFEAQLERRDQREEVDRRGTIS
jgi:hypothetical protein